MKRILITGANGALTKKLLKLFSSDENYCITASTRNINNLENKLPNIRYVNNSEITDSDILNDIDLIINSAFPRMQEPAIMFKAGRFFQELLIKAIEKKVKGFINISSQSVYGIYREKPSLETDTPSPADVYALTKCFLEDIGLCLTKDCSLKLTNIRLAGLIGKEYPERLVNKMINFAAQNKTINVINDKNVFGFMHIDDAAEGLYNFVKHSDLNNWQYIYNFGIKPDYNENLLYIANIIKHIFFEQKINIEIYTDKKEKADKLQTMNSEAFYKAAKWEPKISLENAILRIYSGIIQH